MKSLLLACLALPLLADAQVNLTLSCPSQARAGAAVSCTLTSGGTGTPAGIDGVVQITSGASQVAWTMTTPLTSKSVTAAPGQSNIFVLIGMGNQTVIPVGAIAQINFTMPSGSVSYVITPAAAVDPSGGVIAVATNPPGTIGVQSNCDINSDGVTNLADETQAISAITAGPSAAAALGSGLATAQKVSNAITGACTL